MSTIPALLSKECSTRIFPDGFLSIYEPRQTGLNFGEQMGRSVPFDASRTCMANPNQPFSDCKVL